MLEENAKLETLYNDLLTEFNDYKSKVETDRNEAYKIIQNSTNLDYEERNKILRIY